VEQAVCVIDRESGGPAGLTANGIGLRALYTMTELTEAGTR
jgi:orotate phosphoribosyltransferase